MVRKIITIHEEKCNGCGACAQACHEGAIAIIEGKAKLMREDYCDGLGDCLPACPAGAITFTQREAAAYDEAAVLAAKSQRGQALPGSRPVFAVSAVPTETAMSAVPIASVETAMSLAPQQSQLRQWPVQIKLVPVIAPWFHQADLLVAADCTAYAYANFHQDFMKGRVTLAGCPKLDAVDYSIKLSEIVRKNDVQSITVARMEVPCCGGIEMAVKKALQSSSKDIVLTVAVIATDGTLLDKR